MKKGILVDIWKLRDYILKELKKTDMKVIWLSRSDFPYNVKNTGYYLLIKDDTKEVGGRLISLIRGNFNEQTLKILNIILQNIEITKDDTPAVVRKKFNLGGFKVQDLSKS